MRNICAIMFCRNCFNRNNTIAVSAVLKIKCPLMMSKKDASFRRFPIDEAITGLSEDQIQLRNTISNFVQKELEPIAARIDKENEFKELKSFWKKLGELGALGITVKTEYGGIGGSYSDQAIIMEEISRASGSIGLSYLAHTTLCISQIHRHGTPKQKEKYLPKVSLSVNRKQP